MRFLGFSSRLLVSDETVLSHSFSFDRCAGQPGSWEGLGEGKVGEVQFGTGLKWATYTILNVKSPPSFAFNSSSTSRFSPICNLAGFFVPPLLPFAFGIGGIKLPPPFSTTFARAFLLLRRRRRRRLELLLVLVLLLMTLALSSLIRSCDMSIERWLLLDLGLGRVVVGFATGTGPPGPPRRLGREDLVEGAGEGFGCVAVSGEDIFFGGGPG